MRLLALLFCCALATPLGSLGAQRTITGVVFDSLRSHGPIANAQVALLGSGRRTWSDSAGRFSFRLPAVDSATPALGVAFWAPWLDSLGLPALSQELSSIATADAHVLLSTPSPATYQRAVCGTELAAQDGILLGETRSPEGGPRAGLVVVARWTQTTINAGTLEQSLIATVDTASASGSFALCGVPLGVIVSMRAIGEPVSSGERWVDIHSAVQRHDLIVGAGDRVARVTGRIVRPDGVGLAGAEIHVRDDSTRSVVTGADGSFEFARVARRSSDLVVRAVGHSPISIALDPVGDVVELGVIMLEPLPPELAAVRVTASPFERERLEFERRSRGALGDFITDEMLERIPDISANVVASMAPRLIARQPTGFAAAKPTLMLRRGSGFCFPRFFVDGLDVGTLSVEEGQQVDQWNLLQRAKRIEVYTANQAPAKFNDFDGCGAVVVWTR